ncbi:MAG TPA: hypothetical protein VF329_04230 [Gammaproteobacteria bacterium]
MSDELRETLANMRTISQTARWLGACEMTIRRYVESGRVEAVSVGSYSMLTPEAQRQCAALYERNRRRG